MYEVNIRWVGNHQYVAEGQSGHAIVLDIPEKSGGQNTGPHATELLLIAVGKCSAVDVVNILRKRRIDLKSLRVVVSGEISESYPKYFTRINIKYVASGPGLTVEEVEKAVHLSHEKYCTVSNSLADKVEQIITVEIAEEGECA